MVSVDLAKDRDGKSKGYAVVQFSEPTEAINAIGTYYRFCRIHIASALGDMSLQSYSSLPRADAM